MAEGSAPASREQGWITILLALAAFLFLPLSFDFALPVRETGVLLVPALAVCFLLGWGRGGSLALMLLWVGCAIASLVVLAQLDAPAAYTDLARTWALVSAGTFGVVSLSSPGSRLFPRAFAACGLALLLSGGMLLATGQQPDRVTDVLATEFARRSTVRAAKVQEALRTLEESGAIGVRSALREHVELTVETAREASPATVPVYPALLALESLAAYILAWVLYHRLSRVRLGVPVGRLQDFRFSDELVWGFVAGLVLVLARPPRPLHTVGLNLLVLFGAVYALRGLAIITWSLARMTRGARLVRALTVVWLVLFWWAAPLPALGLGLTDTWMDWRRRARPIS